VSDIGIEKDNSPSDAQPTVPPIFQARTIALVGIFIILLVHFFQFASSILIPITLSLLLSTMLLPLQRALTRLRIPVSVSAALIAIGLTSGIVVGGYALTGPAQSWLERVPSSFNKLERHLRSFKEPIEEIKKATDKLEEATQLDAEKRPVQEVRIREPVISKRMVNDTTQTLISTGIVVVLVLFFLLNGDVFLRKLVSIVPTLSNKKLAVEIVRSIQDDISTYLFALTLINIGLGVVMASIAALVGLENPFLWGTIVTLLSFAPYAGSSITAIILTFAGMLTFDSLLWALIAPSVFLVLMFIYGNFLIPVFLGNRLSLNPVSIFLAIVFWGWLWGIAGALLAVPILASFKIICDRFDALKPVAEFLSP
jgi:predicted PurR-regulated permease PerM